jgi:hypothetical protein
MKGFEEISFEEAKFGYLNNEPIINMKYKYINDINKTKDEEVLMMDEKDFFDHLIKEIELNELKKENEDKKLQKIFKIEEESFFNTIGGPTSKYFNIMFEELFNNENEDDKTDSKSFLFLN